MLFFKSILWIYHSISFEPCVLWLCRWKACSVFPSLLRPDPLSYDVQTPQAAVGLVKIKSVHSKHERTISHHLDPSCALSFTLKNIPWDKISGKRHTVHDHSRDMVLSIWSGFRLIQQEETCTTVQPPPYSEYSNCPTVYYTSYLNTISMPLPKQTGAYAVAVGKTSVKTWADRNTGNTIRHFTLIVLFHPRLLVWIR